MQPSHAANKQTVQLQFQKKHGNICNVSLKALCKYIKAPTQQRNAIVFTCWSAPTSPGCGNFFFCLWPSGTHLLETMQHVAFQQTLIGLFRNLRYEADRMTGFKMVKILRSVQQLAQPMKWKRDAAGDAFHQIGFATARYLSMAYPLWADVCMMAFIETCEFPTSLELRGVFKFCKRVFLNLPQKLSRHSPNACVRSRARWIWSKIIKFLKIKTGHLYSYVKLNFKASLFSCIFYLRPSSLVPGQF